LIGGVVLDIKSPFRAFAPREAVEGTTGRNPQDIIPNLLPTPLLSASQKDFIQNNISGRFELVSQASLASTSPEPTRRNYFIKKGAVKLKYIS
jgi:hypothetical protein